jgi:anti-anti-sigma regulatory factor/DNA-directed RNA polymerase subunit RPC12/RpoP
MLRAGGMPKGTVWNVLEQEERSARIAIAGEISEETDFAPMIGQARPTLVLDLERVARVNSCGIREWLEFVRAIEEKDVQLVLEHCPPGIVAQLNMISNFTGVHGSVRSVYAPYHCSRCHKEHLVLIELERDQDQIKLDDGRPCPSCGGEMDFEDIPETYLQFRETRASLSR